MIKLVYSRKPKTNPSRNTVYGYLKCVTSTVYWSYFNGIELWQVMPVLEQLCCLLRHPYRAVRHLAARCVATLSALDTPAVMDVLVHSVVPQLSAADCVTRRQGAAECLACVAERLQLQIIPYIVLLVVPLLGEWLVFIIHQRVVLSPIR